MTLGIDPKTGQLRSLLARGTGPTGAPADVLTEFDDYRAAGGITVPHARRQIVGGTTAQKVTVKTVQVIPPCRPMHSARRSSACQPPRLRRA